MVRSFRSYRLPSTQALRRRRSSRPLISCAPRAAPRRIAERDTDDPYTIQAIGDLELRLHAAQALLEKAGRAIDRAIEDPNAETVADAQIVTAEAKILSTEIAIAATNKLFELAGTCSTLA